MQKKGADSMLNSNKAIKENPVVNDFDCNIILKIKDWTEEEFKIASAVIAGTRIAHKVNSEEDKPSQ